MVEVGYGMGRVRSDLSQLGSRWFVHASYCGVVWYNVV